MEEKVGPSDKRIKKQLTSIKMKFFRTSGYTLDHKRNEAILEELKVEPVDCLK
jgi:hypothetical protein